jgi:hypothetical protein
MKGTKNSQSSSLSEKSNSSNGLLSDIFKFKTDHQLPKNYNKKDFESDLEIIAAGEQSFMRRGGADYKRAKKNIKTYEQIEKASSQDIGDLYNPEVGEKIAGNNELNNSNNPNPQISLLGSKNVKNGADNSKEIG